MSVGGVPQGVPVKSGHRLAILPTTYPGKWALGLTAASIVFLGLTFIVPRGGFPGVLFGLAGGVLALVAIFGRGERSVGVFAALAPFLTVVVFALAELLAGHA